MAKFKTRARAVDMLGRQQIADVSTAISELFKNAHDAYADHVEVDYFRSDNLLVIRDDGIGMTKDEFENRWLGACPRIEAVARGSLIRHRTTRHSNHPINSNERSWGKRE